MILKRTILLIMILLISACDMQSTKPDSQTNLENLLELRKNADAAYNKGNWSKAVSYYGELSQHVQQDAEVWFKLGNAHARLNHPEIALQSYQKALSIDPENSKAWHNMGIIQLKLATKTFIEMKEHTTPNNPLNIRANYVINAISKLLQQDFGIEAKE